MAKRGRKKKFKLDFDINGEVYRSVGAVGVILFGLLSFISFFAQDYTLNKILFNFFTGIFGFLAILIPLVLVFFGLLFVEILPEKMRNARILVGIVVILICLFGLVSLPGFDVKKSLEIARDGGQGGMLGYYIALLLVQLISIYGAWAVLLCGLIASILITINTTLGKVASALNENVISKIDTNSLKVSLPHSNSAVETGENMSMSALHGQNDLDYAPVPQSPRHDVFEVIPTMSEPQEKSKDDVRINTKDQVISLKPNLPYSDRVWENPPLDLLDNPVNEQPDAGDIKQKSEKIIAALRAFNIPVKVVETKSGPSVTQYALEVPAGVKLTKITNLQHDLAMALASQTGSVRIEAPIPGTAYVGVEVPNNKTAMVNFRSLYLSETMKNVKNRKLGIILGKDVGGTTAVYDIARMPHLLIAGATGSGKSIFIQNILFSILFKASPQEVKFILIDPKRVEMSHYQDIPHLLTPVVTDLDKAASAFKWAVAEMDRRYKLFEKARAKNIDAYNEMSGFQALPYIVVVADELAEIMIADPQAVEKSIVRLAQLSRATGIHLILATQRPSTNIISGIIKANIPARAAFNVASNTDSRVIIDQPGAEKLLGRGDMLFIPPDMPKPVRLQAPFISDHEIENLTAWLRNTGVQPEYKEEVFQMPSDGSSGGSRGGNNQGGNGDRDELYDEAYEIVVTAGKASSSLLQRRLSVGYARAAKLIDQLEEGGVIGPQNGSKPREILITPDQLDGYAPKLPEDFNDMGNLDHKSDFGSNDEVTTLVS